MICFFAGIVLFGIAVGLLVASPGVGCSTSQLEIDGQCYEFTQLEDSFYDTWSTLEENNPEGIGPGLLVSETRLESRDQVVRMIRYLQDEGRATCFRKSFLLETCLPANTTGTGDDME